TGGPYIANFFNQVIMQEMGLYTTICMGIILIVLFLAFRSFSAVLWPALIITLGIVWTIGVIGWSGLLMSMMINIVIFLVLAVGIASSIHVLSGYRLHLSEGKSVT